MSNEASRAEYDQAKREYLAGNYGNALALLDKLALKFPSEKEIIHSRAQCLAMLGRVEEASAACDQLTTIYGDPRGEQLKNTLAIASEPSSPSDVSAHVDTQQRTGSSRKRKGLLLIPAAIIVAVVALMCVVTLRRGPVIEQADGSRLISFPSDRSLGILYDAQEGHGFSELGPARGTVTVRPGHRLRLQVSQEGALDLSPLKRMPAETFEEIDLWEIDVPPEQFRFLSGLTGLQTLDIVVPMDDSTLEHLSGLRNLKSLVVRGTRSVTDQGMTHIQGLSKLEYLNIDGTAVTDEGLRFIADSQNLQSLHLGGSHVEGKMLDFVPNKHGLQRLAINHMGYFKKENLRFVGEFENLTQLFASGLRLVDSDLGMLEGLHNLERLYLSDNAITDNGIPYIVGLPKLKFLEVNNTKITEAGLAKLASALPGCEVRHSEAQ